LFKVDGYFRPKQFLNVLSINVKELIKNNKWSIEEKKIIDNTFDRFNKISRLQFYDNRCNRDNNKISFHNKNESNSNERYPKNKPYNNTQNKSWRKQKNQLSENGPNNSHKNQSASKYIDHNKSFEKQGALDDQKTPKHQHKAIDSNFKLPIKNSIEPTNSLNDSNNIETKLKKFENKFNSLKNVHVVSLENSSINKSFSRPLGRGNRYGGYKLSWRHPQDDTQNQDNFEIFHNHSINSQQSERYKNVYPKNQQVRNPKSSIWQLFTILWVI